MEDVKQRAGQIIKAARLQKGLTQKELGDKVGVGGPTINKYETGNQNLTIETLQKVAEALGLNLGLNFHK